MHKLLRSGGPFMRATFIGGDTALHRVHSTTAHLVVALQRLL